MNAAKKSPEHMMFSVCTARAMVEIIAIVQMEVAEITVSASW